MKCPLCSSENVNEEHRTSYIVSMGSDGEAHRDKKLYIHYSCARCGHDWNGKYTNSVPDTEFDEMNPNDRAYQYREQVRYNRDRNR